MFARVGPLVLLALAACGASGRSTAVGPAPSRAVDAGAGGAPSRGAFVASLERDAARLEPLFTTAFARRFLAATRALPSIASRTVYRTPHKELAAGASRPEHRWFATRAAAPKPDQPSLVEVVVDEEQYYAADLSAPLHFARPLEVAARRGLVLDSGSRVVDFGYGSIGHLRLLASLGVEATGIDVRPQLPVFYSSPGDLGAIEGGGAIRILNGRFPAEVRPGPAHDLFVAKNTLKKGYIHPDRPAPPSSLIDLGVDDATFLRAVHDTLRPGGWALVYNLFVPVPVDMPFKPMSDGRSPFTREQWRAAGLDVVAFDEDDTQAIQLFLTTEKPDDPSRREIRALYTIARRTD